MNNEFVSDAPNPEFDFGGRFRGGSCLSLLL
jgi:hypothetical protein